MDVATERTEYTRQELYDAVWSKSAVQLASEIGVSDVTLAKTCKTYEIPKPPSGYWAKVKHGKRVHRPALPPLTDSSRQVIHFNPLANTHRPSPVSAAAEDRARAEEEESNRVTVPATLASPHPLVERTRRALSSAKPENDGLLVPRGDGCLQVAIGRDSVDRAMRIMHALITAATGRGVKVECDNSHRWTTLLHVSSEVFALRLSESLGTRKRNLTAAKKRTNDELPGFTLYPKTEKYPCGSLSLTIRGEKDEAVQKRWAERDGTRLDDRLNEVIAWLFRAADRLGARRRDRDEWRRQFDEERREHEEAERRRVEEERKLEVLERDAGAWRRACRIRSYVNAVERAAVERGDGIGEDSEVVA